MHRRDISSFELDFSYALLSSPCLPCSVVNQSPYQANLLIAGFDKDVGPSLYYLDYISTLHKLDFTAMGYGGNFILSLMDKLYKKNLTQEEALQIVDKCIDEIRLRLFIAPANFLIKIVDKDGARELGWRRTVNEDGSRTTGSTVVPSSSGPQPISA